MPSSKEYMRDYMRLRWRRRRICAIAALGGACTKCGAKHRLQFDHRDPSTKLFTIARGTSVSEIRFWAEIAKCQLLCKECHKIKSLPENAAAHPPVHGTRSRYTAGCRCAACKEAKRRTRCRC